MSRRITPSQQIPFSYRRYAWHYAKDLVRQVALLLGYRTTYHIAYVIGPEEKDKDQPLRAADYGSMIVDTKGWLVGDGLFDLREHIVESEGMDPSNPKHLKRLNILSIVRVGGQMDPTT